MNFTFQFGEFSSSEGLDWITNIVTIVTSFGSAFIGALVALKVYRDTVRDQKSKEENQKNSLETSKLKYLGFLMTDVFINLGHLIDSIRVLKHKYAGDKLQIPTFNLYHLDSVLIISQKINQEDYYNASINQLKNDGVAEMFYIINSIARQNEQLIKNYNIQFDDIVGIMNSIPKALDASKDSISAFIRKVDNGDIEDDFYEEISDKLVAMILYTHKMQMKIKNQPNLHNYYSLIGYVRPTIQLLTPFSHLSEITDIVYKAHEVEAIYLAIDQKISHMINIAERQVDILEKVTNRLSIVSEPLRLFYVKNKININV